MWPILLLLLGAYLGAGGAGVTVPLLLGGGLLLLTPVVCLAPAAKRAADRSRAVPDAVARVCQPVVGPIVKAFHDAWLRLMRRLG